MVQPLGDHAYPAEPVRPARPRLVDPAVSGPTSGGCRCGHGRTAHQHYRRGSDCALCDCARFRRRTLLGRLLPG